MEILTDTGRVFINDLSKIYMVEFNSGRYNTSSNYIIITWLTKKYDYEETYYDFKDKTLYFNSKNKALEVYNDLIKILQK